MKAVALQSTSDTGHTKGQRNGQINAQPVSPRFASPVSSIASAVIQRKAGCACGGGCPECQEELDAQNVQPKLAISTPGDPLEHEADRVADQVMRMTDASGEQADAAKLQVRSPPSRAASAYDEEQPLPAETRAFFEPRFGRDLSEVRIHTGARAEGAARKVYPVASTMGRDVVFGSGRYAPETMQGKQLLTREADSVADQVMRVPSPRLQRACACGGSCPACKSEPEEGLRTKRVDDSGGGGAAVPAIVTDVVPGPGQPLDAGARAFMEPRFGHSFSGVRVHTDARAADAARAVSARAYTHGHDVVFASGQYAPQTEAGMRLLAHELTHVVQQGGGQSLAGHVRVTRIPSRLSRMIQRLQTDAGFEAASGVGPAIAGGTMVANNSIMGHTFTAQNCRGLYGCNINFEFGKAYSGDYPYVAAGRDVRGVYVKIAASFDSSKCGACNILHLIQDYRDIKQTAGRMVTAEPDTAIRKERAGWSAPGAASRGWSVDRVETATNPLYSSGPSSNPGSAATPAVMWDAPGFWSNDTNHGSEFQSCALCEKPGLQRKVMACVNWGYYIDSAGAVSFRPAVPVPSCGPTQELQDATTRWEAIAGNLPANIDFTKESPVDQRGQGSVLWFQVNSTTLRQDAEINSVIHVADALLRIRQHLAVGADARIVVHGYASEEGDAANNLQLSRRRAEAIQAQLIAAGIPPNRMTIQAHGEDTTMPTRAFNRRVEIEHTIAVAAGATP